VSYGQPEILRRHLNAIEGDDTSVGTDDLRCRSGARDKSPFGLSQGCKTNKQLEHAERY
jgi:hypothetical protein